MIQWGGYLHHSKSGVTLILGFACNEATGLAFPVIQAF